MDERTYYGLDGNERSLWQMIREEPGWAESRIKHGERLEAEREQLRELAGRWKDRCEATREYVEVLQEENAELSAWVEQIRMAADQIESYDLGSARWSLAVVRILDSLGRPPNNSLAQRDARMKAEVLDKLLYTPCWLRISHVRHEIKRQIAEYHQQTEGGVND